MHNEDTLKVTVSVQMVIDKLTEHRDRHVKLVAKARESFVCKSLETLEKELKSLAKTKGTKNVSLHLTAPVDQTRDYDDAIAMLSMHKSSNIDLSEKQMKAYVLDRWPWASNFSTVNSAFIQEGELPQSYTQGS